MHKHNLSSCSSRLRQAVPRDAELRGRRYSQSWHQYSIGAGGFSALCLLGSSTCLTPAAHPWTSRYIVELETSVGTSTFSSASHRTKHNSARKEPLTSLPTCLVQVHVGSTVLSVDRNSTGPGDLCPGGHWSAPQVLRLPIPIHNTVCTPAEHDTEHRQ